MFKPGRVNDGLVQDIRAKVEDVNQVMGRRKEIMEALKTAVANDEIQGDMIERASMLDVPDGVLPDGAFDDLIQARMSELFEKPSIEIQNASRIQELLMKRIGVYLSLF